MGYCCIKATKVIQPKSFLMGDVEDQAERLALAILVVPESVQFLMKPHMTKMV